MTVRYYKNAPSHTIPGGVANASTTTIVVDSVTGWPTQFPFACTIEPDSALEEIVDVTNIAGTTLTVARGVDGSTASAHAAGSVIAHSFIARDATEANAHNNATTGVHGATGSLVDTGSNQSVGGNKTLTGTTTLSGPTNLNGTNTVNGVTTFAAGAVVNAGATLGTGSTLASSDGSVDTQIKGDGTGRIREVAVGRHVRKSSDQGVTVTTMTNATDLVLPVVANGVYEVDIELMFESTSSTANLKIGWSLPSGTFDMTGIGPGTGVTGATAVTGNFVGIIGASSAVLVFGSPAAGTPTFCVRLKARLAIGGSGGNAQLQFAENTASATVTMKAGSWMTETKRS